MDLLQHEIDRVKPKSDEWKKGPRISAEDVRRGTGNIEHISADEFFGRSGKPGTVATGQVAAQPQVTHVMMFGKHRGKTFETVRNSDPGYWSWCCREVSGFSAKAKKAGLLDD